MWGIHYFEPVELTLSKLNVLPIIASNATNGIVQFIINKIMAAVQEKDTSCRCSRS